MYKLLLTQKCLNCQYLKLHFENGISTADDNTFIVYDGIECIHTPVCKDYNVNDILQKFIDESNNKKNAPTPEEFASKMRSLQKDFRVNHDKETCHIEMDQYLCETLTKLGYNDGVLIFRTTEKWYA